ncbi:MAG TPA: hypothetical protein VGA08_00575 [Candidatus Saccharimonadales bacterium]
MKTSQKGDTIVEVLLATVVLSVVLAGAFALTNRATRVNQAANERTIVANQTSEQLELVKAIGESANSAAWGEIRQNHLSSGSPSLNSCTASGRPFYIDPADANLMPVGINFSQFDGSEDAYSDVFNVWLEAYDVGPAINFYARACWEGIGSEGEQRSISILRVAD